MAWTDKHGLTLHKTTDPAFYFLEVDKVVQSYLRPFLELKEVKAIWHTVLETGWLLPAEVFPDINAFLTIFHEVIPSKDEEEGLRNIKLKDHATTHFLAYQEVRLLIVLSSIWEDIDPKMVDYTIKVSSHPKIAGTEWQNWLFDYNNTWWFMSIKYRYLASLYAGTDTTIRRGDVLKLDYVNEDEGQVAVATDETFVPLTYEGDVGAHGEFILPVEFKVPQPFPNLYWEGVIPSGTIVHPNFGELAGIMEYEDEPVLPNDPDPDRFPSDNKWVALRFELGDVTHRIYFVLHESKPSYQDVLDVIADPDTVFYAIDDHTIVW